MLRNIDTVNRVVSLSSDIKMKNNGFVDSSNNKLWSNYGIKICAAIKNNL